LDANDSATSATWNPASPTNPFSAMRASCDASHLASGIYPNRMFIGSLANSYLFSVLEAKDGVIGGIRSLRDVADRLTLAEAEICRTVYASKLGTGNKTRVLGADIYFYYAEEGLTVEDPSAIKRFVSPTAAGGDYAVYINETSKFIEVTVEHYSQIIATGALGIQKLTVANA
jgi:hypothetical protein